MTNHSESESSSSATPGGPTPGGSNANTGEELLFDPHGSSELGHATVKTQHSHEAGREIRQNIILPGEQGWNKWLGNCYESWVDIEFPSQQCIGGVAFKSANDCDYRDPKQVVVQTWENEDWQEVGSYSPEWHGRRWDTIKYDFEESIMTTKMRFIFKNPNHGCIQLG